MKPISFNVAVFVLCLTSFLRAESLRVLTWEEYIAPEVVAAFEAETGISVEFVYFEHDESRDQIMAETTGFGFDLVLVDDQKMGAYIQQNWIRPIRISELSHYDLEWQRLIPEAAGYGLPYGYGNYGILYRSDLVPTAPTRWADLMADNNVYSGKIIMPGQYSELLLIGQLVKPAPDYSLEDVRKMLVQQSTSVHSYQSLEVSLESPLITGEAWVGVAYNSDALLLKDLHEQLEFISPEEGTVLWVDFWAVSAHSQRVRYAEQFLAFISQPTMAAKNIEYTYTASFHTSANALIDAEIRDNPLIYPDISEPVRFPMSTRESLRIMMQLRNDLRF